MHGMSLNSATLSDALEARRNLVRLGRRRDGCDRRIERSARHPETLPGSRRERHPRAGDGQRCSAHVWHCTVASEAAMSKSGNFSVLLVTTWAFTICFAVWMMFGVTGIPIRAQLGLDSTQFGLLTATPVLTGALFRLPLGIWTDRFGGRILMLLLLVGCAVPLWVSSYATELWQFLLLGLALGLVGASFSVGTPYVARFFPKERRGFAMGFFGAGTVGAALNMFVAPVLINRYGWEMVPRVYAIGLLVTAGLFWIFSAPDPGAGKATASMSQQLSVLRDPRVWKYCQYYSIVFGGFTALSVWMPQYFRTEYGFSIAQASLLAASF